MLVCIEVKSDSGSGLVWEAAKMRDYIETYIRGAKVDRLIVTEEEHRLLEGFHRGLGIDKNDSSDVMVIYSIPVVRARNE